jgi:hypothetical protein
MEVCMTQVDLPIPDNEDALDEYAEEMEALEEEDEVDEKENDVEEDHGGGITSFVGSTEILNEDLETADFLNISDITDEGDDEQGDWVFTGDRAGPAMASQTQAAKTHYLTAKQRTRARRIAVRAALLGLHHAEAIHYTQGGSRWQGIADTRYSARNQYPNYADCSAFVTWCLWNGLFIPYRKPDVVNGANWKAGYTGTMIAHGRPIRQLKNVRWGDAVLYGAPGSTGRHTAIIVKVGRPRGSNLMVVSHGSEGGPYYLPYNYRRDIHSIRRYIHYRV